MFRRKPKKLRNVHSELEWETRVQVLKIDEEGVEVRMLSEVKIDGEIRELAANEGFIGLNQEAVAKGGCSIVRE